MAIWFSSADKAGLRSIAANTMIEHLGIEFIELGDDFLRRVCQSTGAPCSRPVCCTAAHR